MNLNDLTLARAHEGLAGKEFSSEDLTRACLDRIRETDEEFGAFLVVDEKGALEAARSADKKIHQGEASSPLLGVPVALKDAILVQGLACTAGSRILENYAAAYDATVTRKLRESGAVILGKTNMDEFAMGSSTENSAFHPTKNPRNPKYVPGGSSGGSAAAVAADQCIFSLGSDTGGSIRQPASLCGVVGLKPTYGSVSRYGLIAMSSSLDVIGPFAKTVEDARLVFSAISGKDPMDGTTIETPNSQLPAINLKNVRIGIPKEYFVDGMDLVTEKLVREAIKKLESLGATIVDVSLPHASYALAVYYVLMPAEVSANLSRFDGIRYGASLYRESPSSPLSEIYTKTRSRGFGEEAKRRIMLGAYALSAGYRDAYYGKAQTVRALIKEDFDRVWSKVDCLATPTSPSVAWRFGERVEDPLSMYLADIFTISANLAGIPAMSLPCGQDGGLPVGLQLMGPAGGEAMLFGVGETFEAVAREK
ncbi:MAG: Asp-tRNA(Asn)/Glu-tRNA(Gln) amidotransferase subunit GatA [Patescibacteria group bacterium]